MLDAVSLDQLRTFIAAVDEGSFSAASRKLLRAQSVVSETISNLEDQIGVRLFDRSGRYPKLTAAGSNRGAHQRDAPGRGLYEGRFRARLKKAHPESLPWKRSKWLPPRHDCCGAATLGEDLTLITGSSCPRRFLATPLHEIIFRRTNRPPTRGSVGKSAGETGSRWTPRPTSRGSCRAVT